MAPRRVVDNIRTHLLLAAVGTALGLFLGYLAIRGVEWAEVRRHIEAAPLWGIAAALGLVQLSNLLRALRWRMLWLRDQVTTLRLFLVENASLGLNNIAPVRILDEPALLTMLSVRDKLPPPAIVATMVMTRVQDLCMTLLFVAAALIFEPNLTQHAASVAAVSLITITLLGALLNLGRLTRRFPVLERVPGVRAYGEAAASLLTRRRRLAMTGSLTASYWLVLGPAAWVLAWSMGVEITLFQAAIVALGATFFATSIPALPGALGSFELAVVSILGVWGIDQELALGFGLLLHTALFLPPVLIAAVVLPREGFVLVRRSSAKRGRALSRTEAARAETNWS